MLALPLFVLALGSLLAAPIMAEEFADSTPAAVFDTSLRPRANATHKVRPVRKLPASRSTVEICPDDWGYCPNTGKCAPLDMQCCSVNAEGKQQGCPFTHYCMGTGRCCPIGKVCDGGAAQDTATSTLRTARVSRSTRRAADSGTGVSAALATRDQDSAIASRRLRAAKEQPVGARGLDASGGHEVDLRVRDGKTGSRSRDRRRVPAPAVDV